MKWIPRKHPKLDRIACPWLIIPFIDKDAQIIYMPFVKVISIATELAAEPFEYTRCIAYLTGFSDQSHFNRIFKKQMGMTASEYRKTLLNSKIYTLQSYPFYFRP